MLILMLVKGRDEMEKFSHPQRTVMTGNEAKVKWVIIPKKNFGKLMEKLRELLNRARVLFYYLFIDTFSNKQD